MGRLVPPKIETVEDLNREIEKWKPLNFRKLSLLLGEIVARENEQSIETIKRIVNVLEKSRENKKG